MYQSMQITGNMITLSFKNIGSGLITKTNDGNLSGFEIAGEDKKFYQARAFIKDNKVIVSSDAVLHPVAVRLGWADNAGDDNLFNKEGFPAAPFRTDKWKGITEAAKFEIQH
jgi:sialate O-acetylesterase